MYDFGHEFQVGICFVGERDKLYIQKLWEFYYPLMTFRQNQIRQPVIAYKYYSFICSQWNGIDVWAHNID